MRPLKYWKIVFFTEVFFYKKFPNTAFTITLKYGQKLTTWGIKNEAEETFTCEITDRRSCYFVTPMFVNVTVMKQPNKITILLKYNLLKACLEWKPTWKLEGSGLNHGKMAAIWILCAIERSFPG